MCSRPFDSYEPVSVFDGSRRSSPGRFAGRSFRVRGYGHRGPCVQLGGIESEASTFVRMLSLCTSVRVPLTDILDKCIRLSIADMERNESLLIAASYFWSDTLNAFVFGHGPASPSLADVLMLTGLDISTADNNHLFDNKPSSKVESRSIGGWSGYIQKYRKTGSVGEREHVIFLNMWLDKFVFCGRSAGPTSVYQSAAERLANGG